MKYKVGDRVRIKSLDWYNENRNDDWGSIELPNGNFYPSMAKYCGEVLTIIGIKNGIYLTKEGDSFNWTDEMIEGLAEEEEIKPIFKVGDKITNGKDKLLILNIVSDKYIVEDNLGECGTVYFNTQDYWKLVEEENKKEDIAWMYDGKLVAERFSDGVVINQPKYNKLSINTEFCYDKVELVISPDFELKQEDDRWFAIKKKKPYPKTYKECTEIIAELTGSDCNPKGCMGYMSVQLTALQKLLICRDAYWKLYGEEMGLGKPWEPDWSDYENIKYIVGGYDGEIGYDQNHHIHKILAFPTEEMRDAFYENFKELIEQCKELL